MLVFNVDEVSGTGQVISSSNIISSFGQNVEASPNQLKINLSIKQAEENKYKLEQKSKKLKVRKQLTNPSKP